MRALAAAALVLALASAGAAAVSAASSPHASVIAFGRAGWIWRSAADGSHARRVVRGEAPLFSPDGRFILFVRRYPRTRQAELRVLPSRGRTSRALYRFRDGLLSAARWLPDSRRFLVLRPDGRYLGGLARSALVALFPSLDVEALDVSPDGASAVLSVRGRDGLFVAALPDGEPRPLVPGAHGIWGPLGWIAFARGRQVWVVRPDGSEAHPLPGLVDADAAFVPLEWSGDGRRLLVLEPGLHASRLWVAEPEAGTARPLAPRISFLIGGSLSRDGTRALAFQDRPFGRGSCHVLRVGASGAVRKVLTGPCGADWNA